MNNKKAPSAFSFPGIPSKLIFGRNARFDLHKEIQEAGFQRPLVVTTSRGVKILQEIQAESSLKVASIFEGAIVHVPTEVIAEVRKVAVNVSADGVIAIGGGSAIGLAKALAHYDNLPYIAIPTTLSGSEMTSIWGETTDGHKKTSRDAKVRPITVIYDSVLLETMPKVDLVQSGLNAFAHVAEAAYANNASPLSDMFVREASGKFLDGLNDVEQIDQDKLANLSVASCLAGVCLTSTTMSLHHKICHVIGGALNLPHAATHAIVLPHTLAFILPKTLDSSVKLHGSINQPIEDQVWAILHSSNGPISIRELHEDSSRIPELAKRVFDELGNPQAAPFAISIQDIEELLGRAWRGDFKVHT